MPSPIRIRMRATLAGSRSRLATEDSSPVTASSVNSPHDSTPSTSRAWVRMRRMVSSTSRLWLTARPASSSAWVSRARRWLSSKRRAFWMAMPAWSAKASSSIWWRSVKKPGVVEKAEMTPMISPATRRGTLSMERMPSFSSTSRCAERASSAQVVGAHRLPRGGGATDDALADRHAQQAPLRRAESVGRGVIDGRAIRVEEPDAAPRAGHQAGDRAADRLEHGAQIQPRRDELARCD